MYNHKHYFLDKKSLQLVMFQLKKSMVLSLVLLWNVYQIFRWWWWWWWWWWWIVFAEWLTDERHLALLPAETIVRDSHHRKSRKLRKQDLNRTEPEFRVHWIKMCSSDNHLVKALNNHYTKSSKPTALRVDIVTHNYR